MNWESFTHRKKLLIKFGIVYFATVVLLVGGFLLSSGHEPPPVVGQQPAPEQIRAATVSAIDKANDLLGRHADRLRQLDGKYISQLIDSFSRPALEDINGAIHTEEMSFRKAVDSLELQGSPYISLAAAFRNVLNDHVSLSAVRMSLPSGVRRSGDRQQELLHALKELQEKDDRIGLLQRRLQELSGEDRGGRATADARALPGLQADIDVLRQRLTEEQKAVADLREQLGGAQRANEALNTHLNEANGTAGSRDASNSTLIVRNSTLERKTTELADELRFAQVDCSLSRVDGRQLIYTAKQRKDLLTDALATLSDLVRSPNTEVQRKAKERLDQLKSLATTVHD